MEARASTALLRLLRQDELPEPLRSLGQRYLIELGRKGRFVPAVRLTPHSAPMWPEEAVRRFLETKLQDAGREGVQ